MKILLFLPLLFACNIGILQSPDSASIIGKSIKIGNLEIAQNDFSKSMNWYDAVKECNDLGNGFRLPTEKEIYDILFYNKAKIGMLHSIYWSNSDGFDYDYAKSMSFIVDKSGIMEARKLTKFYVRAVRTVK